MDTAGNRNNLASAWLRPRLIGLVVLAALIAIRIWDPLPIKLLRFQVFDSYQKIQPRVNAESQVVIVDIDEVSLAQVGQWPWPRTVVADLVRRLIDSGAKGIGFDIVFAESDRSSPGYIADSIVELDQSTRELLKRLPDNDATLAEAFKRSQVVISESGLEKKSLDRDRLPPTTPALRVIGEDPRPYLITYAGLLRSIPELEAAAAGHGVISIPPEPDGVVRRVPALLRVGPYILPTLSLELLRVASGQSTLSVFTESSGLRGVAISRTLIPTDQAGRIWVYFAKRNPHRYIPAAHLLNNPPPLANLKGKLVLIGTSAIGLGDIKVTPLEGRVPGVEIHAQILDMVLGKAFLTRPNFALATEVFSILLLGLLLIVIVPSCRALSSMVLAGSVIVGMIGISWYGYSFQGILLDASFGSVGLLGLYGLLSYVNYIREEMSRRRIRYTFSRYLSPTLVDQLARHSGQLQLGGETKDMTVMFCDVRHFTSISEKFQSDPQGLTRLINSLLTPLTEVILHHKGTIDKYMGDSIMAFWNAPLDDAVHALNACRAALEMLQKLKGLNEGRRQEGTARGEPFLPLKVGIGINTGRCVVGNLGSEHRFDYSVLGDSVNIASRLEGQSKTYELDIVIGPHTADLVRDDFALLEVDLIALKGKQEPARTFTVLGDHQLCCDPNYQRLFETHSAMLAAFRNRQWLSAQALLTECRQIPHAPLGVYKQYEDRIAHYQQHPPPPDWVGVFVAASK